MRDGMMQHPGKWPGNDGGERTGYCTWHYEGMVLVDIRMLFLKADFRGRVAVTFSVWESGCGRRGVRCESLVRNLNLVLQIIELETNVVCVNLMDEERKKHIDWIWLCFEATWRACLGTTAR
jgi:hypothetical protein